MKKLWQGNLSSTLSNFSTNLSAVSTGAASQIKQLTAPEVKPVAAANPAANAQNDKQYLRLPIESARKLRWYDKEDLQAIVKTHVREKRELLDAITALKKLLIRAGYTDATLDLETRHLLTHVENLRESDDGVHMTLLVGAQAELEILKARNIELEADLQDLRKQVATATSQAQKAQFSIVDDLDASPTSPPFDPELLHDLMCSMGDYERLVSSSAMIARQLRTHEQRMAEAEAYAAIRVVMAAANASAATSHAADSDPHTELNPSEVSQLQRELAAACEARVTLVAKLQRLEVERRGAIEEITELNDQLRELMSAQETAGKLGGQLAALEDQNAMLKV